MQEYTVGFCFDDDATTVALMIKTKPAWQVGKFNGVGGKCERFETPHDCMVREFQEETGVLTEANTWNKFLEINDRDIRVHCFYCFNTLIQEQIDLNHTEETILIITIHSITLDDRRCIHNLPWTLSMCLEDRINRLTANVHYD